MEEIVNNNDNNNNNNTIGLDKRDSKGRFVKGCVANPKGSNQFTSIVPLLKALEETGKQKGEEFWNMVARKTWESDTVLIAVLKKVLPDKIAGEGFDTDIKNITVIFGKEKIAADEKFGSENSLRAPLGAREDTPKPEQI